MLAARERCRTAGRGRPHRSDVSFREMSLLVGGRLPRRRRERRRELRPPVSEWQSPDAAHSQPGGQRRCQEQRKYLRDRVSPLGPAPGTQSSHRGDRPSTMSAHLVDPAPRSPLRRTGTSGHQTIKASTHGENDPAAPKPWLPDRITESSTPQSTTSGVIFDPEGGVIHPDLAAAVSSGCSTHASEEGPNSKSE